MRTKEIPESYTSTDRFRKEFGFSSEDITEFIPIGAGEYNANYSFISPVTHKTLVFRINFASQMHLDNQIQYEFNALALLKDSNRTPRPLYYDGSRALVPYGVGIMEYLPGTALDYDKHLSRAAALLADIHATDIPSNTSLIAPLDPLRAIFDECTQMYGIYCDSDVAKTNVMKSINHLMKVCDKLPSTCCPTRCIINTELNATNFLMAEEENATDYLVDWEKPLLADPVQDLAHFLAPTTTLFKTPRRLTPQEMSQFISTYITNVDERFSTTGMRERFANYLQMTCLRGVTWCAMASVEYARPDRTLKNDLTSRKIQEFLKPEFIEGLCSISDSFKS